MGRFPSAVLFEAVELEPVAGERRFQFRGPGLDPEHLGVFIDDPGEAAYVATLLERAHAAGYAQGQREGATATLDAVYAGLRELAPAPEAEPEGAEPTHPDACLEPFAYGGDDAE